MKRVNKILLIYEIICICLLLNGCYDVYPIENLGIFVGVGYDIEKDSGKDKDVTFVDPAEIPMSHDNGKPSCVYTGKGDTIYELVQNRMKKMPTKFTVGTEQLGLISEERAKYGIMDVIDAVLRDSKSNLNCLLAVTKGKCDYYLSRDNNTDETNSKILYDLLTFSHYANFFPYGITAGDVIQMYYQEGRKIFIPYIEIVNKKPEITGLALFDSDKMVYKIPMNETRLINMLRNEKSKGYISLSASSDLDYFDIDKFDDFSLIISNSPIHYIDIMTDCKRKVKVSKDNENLKYSINLNITGDLFLNTMVKQYLDKKTIGLIEETLNKKLEKILTDEINKIQKVYGDDYLDLGKYAVAKYGRQKDVSSKENFQNAIIELKVNVTIKSVGRNSRL
jgi:Ger(x)C family germination protein